MGTLRSFAGSVKMLFRQRQMFSIRLLFFALLIAVTTVAFITLMSDQLKDALAQSSTRFIAGDRQLVSPREVPQEWLERAGALQLKSSRALEFRSMLHAAGNMQLVSVKAVDDSYPLKGDLIRDNASGERVVASKPPQQGEVWLHKRLFPLLNIEDGDSVTLGESSLRAAHVLVQEPDTGFSLAGLAPRVLMHFADVDATGVVQPGSRLTWRYYFTGAPEALENFDQWLKPRLDSSQKWEGVKEGQPAIADAMDKTETYLLLGGSLAVLLSCIAIAMAARQFARDQTETVAIMKTLGVSGRNLISRYLHQLLALGVVASLAGLCLGGAAFVATVHLLRSWMPDLAEVALVPQNFEFLWLTLMTAFISLFSFAMPQFMQLRRVTPMYVLRMDEVSLQGWSWSASGLAFAGILGLLYLYAQNAVLIALLLLSVVSVGVIIATLGFAVYLLSKRGLLGLFRLGSPVHQALNNLLRRRSNTIIQLSVLSFAVMLFALIYLARASLVQDWQSQLPEDAPNHFLINIAPADLEKLRETLNSENIKTSGLYPMVRGRMTHINDVSVKVAVSKDVGALNRELNLTWAEAVPADNEVVAGRWWQGRSNRIEAGPYAVSVESELSEKLDVGVGDKLRFAIAGSEVETVVRSIRTVQWDSMRPNFYIMFEPGSLADFPATYITSFYLSSAQKDVLNKLSQEFPTVSILELDQLVDKLRMIISQVSRMIEIVLVLILLSALSVMSALIGTTLKERSREAALMRTMGATRNYIQHTQFIEFAMMGLVAGFIAALCSELVMWQVQQKLFASGFRPHWEIWWGLPLLSALISGMANAFQIRRVPNTSPMKILREV